MSEVNMYSFVKTARVLAIASALFVCAAQTALADGSANQAIKERSPKGITAMYYACIDKAGAQTAKAACLGAEEKRQDVRLNTAYKTLLKKLDNNAKQALIKAERIWVTLDERSFDFEDIIYPKVDDYSERDLEIEKNHMLRLAERADILEQYLLIINGQ